MLSIFFNPTYFALRRIGETSALILATSFVFFMTWFLHAYQWFWLRGSFLLVLHDMLFWVFLGVLVIVNMLIETRYCRKRSLSRRRLTNPQIARLALKRIATFLFIASLWSFWTSNSIEQWWGMIKTAFAPVSGDYIEPVASWWGPAGPGCVDHRRMDLCTGTLTSSGKASTGYRHHVLATSTVVSLFKPQSTPRSVAH